MTKQEVLELIARYIIKNDNGEITATVLQPILEQMVLQPNILIGRLELLNTTEKDSLVDAINSIVSMNIDELVDMVNMLIDNNIEQDDKILVIETEVERLELDKADKTEIPDISGLATKVEVSEGLDLKANQTDVDADLLQLNTEIGQVEQSLSTKIGDAPADGKQYARQDESWIEFIEGAQANDFEMLEINLQSSPPTKKGFYFPTEAGIYANYGNIEVTAEQLEQLVLIILYNGDTSFYLIEKSIPALGVVEEGNTEAVSGGEVFNKFKEIGVNFNQGEIINFVPDLVTPDFDDLTKWTVGLYQADGSLFPSSGWRAYNFYVELPKGTYTTNLYFTGTSHLCFYDADKVLTRSFTSRGLQNGTYTWSFDILDGEKYIRFSRRINEVFDSFVNGNKPNEYLDTVYSLSKDFESNTLDILSNFNIKTTEIGFNFLEELTNSDYSDVDIWGQNAFLTEIGNLSTNQPDFFYTKKYYEINGNIRYRFRNRYNGNAKCLIYDKDKNVIQVLENLTSTWIQDVFLTTPSNAKYIRLSMRGNYTTTILLANEDIIYNPVTVEVSDDVKTTNVNAVSGKGVADNFIRNNTLISSEKTNAPIVTFISDDGRYGNLDWYLPMLEANNCRSTLAIVGSWLDGGMGYTTMTRDEVRECYLKGHDIASHTNTHPYMTQITPEQLDNELYKSRFALAEIGIDAKMFVAPFGNRNTEVDRALRKYFNTDFITVNDATIANKTCTNLPPLDRFNLKRISFDARNNIDSRLEICKKAVDVLVEKGGWLVFAVHPHYPEYLQTQNPDGYEVRRQELQDLITYIRSKDINILPANLAYEYYKNQVQIGDLRLDSDHYIIGSDLTTDNTMY